MHTCGVLFLLFAVLATGTHCVKINRIDVPSYHVVKDPNDPEDLVLDCDYDIDSKEEGFVLQWWWNDDKIYEWIPTQEPWVKPFIRDNVDTSYVASRAEMHKHRALVIKNPTWNMSGIYTCSAQSHITGDTRKGSVQIIDVTQITMDLTTKEFDDDIEVECTAEDAYPQPKLVIRLGEDNNLPIKSQNIKNINGTFDVTLVALLKGEDAKSSEDLECVLTMQGTNVTLTKSLRSLDNGVDSSNRESAFNLLACLIALIVSTLLGQQI